MTRPPLTPDTAVPVRGEGVLCQRAGDRLVLLSLETGLYYALDEVGARVWELCDGRRGLAQIAAVVVDEFDAPPATVARDVAELVRELECEQLVSVQRR